MITKEQLAEALSQHRRWLQSQGAEGARANLSGADLRMLDLSGADLRNAKLRGTNFERVDLRGTDLSGSELQRARFDYASMEGTQLSGVDLSEASLQGAGLEGVRLDGVLLRQTVFDDARLARTSFKGALGMQASFNRCDLSSACLDGARLEDSQFKGANLSGASLRQALLWGADFRGAGLFRADFGSAQLEDALFDEGVEIQGTGGEGVQLSRRQLEKMMSMKDKGRSVSEIARRLTVSRATVYENLTQERQLDARDEAGRWEMLDRSRRLDRSLQVLGNVSLMCMAAAALMLVGSGLLDMAAALGLHSVLQVPNTWYWVWAGALVLFAGSHLFCLWMARKLVEASAALPPIRSSRRNRGKTTAASGGGEQWRA